MNDNIRYFLMDSKWTSKDLNLLITRSLLKIKQQQMGTFNFLIVTKVGF